MKKNVQDLVKSDFPIGVPVLKWKYGLYYRPNNSGYTNNILDAGFYEREEALKYCFEGEKNGSCGVYAMSLEMAINQNYLSTDKLNDWLKKIEILRPLTTVKNYNTVNF